MREVTMLQNDDSALDLSVKCGRISLRRTTLNEEMLDEYIKTESEESFEATLNGPPRKRPYGCAELESISPPPPIDEMRERHFQNIYKSESDSDSQFSSRYSPLHQGSSGNGLTTVYGRNRASPIDELTKQNGCAMYPMEAGSPDEGVAFVQGQSRVMPVPLKYVSEMQGLNGMTRDEFTSLTKHLISSNVSSNDVLQKLYPDCVPFGFSFPGNFYGNVTGTPSGAVPARIPSPSQVPSSSCPPNAQGLSGILGDLRSPQLFHPRKRFLAEIRRSAEGIGQASPSSEPNSTSPHFPATSTATDESTPTCSEEKKLAAARSCASGGSIQEKDEAYWERRRKNNEAAKRSRDIRRQKEEQVAARAASLSAENVQLRAQIEVLKNQLALIQSMVINGAHRQS